MKKGDIFLSTKEARRVYIMEQVLNSKLTVGQAAELLSLSPRQVKRLKGGMKKNGIAFLAHKNRGRKPKRALSREVRDQIIDLITTKYHDSSCIHVVELLSKYQGITVSPRTIGRIMTEAGIPKRYARKVCRRRRSRDRMPQEGLLVQCDASPYEWFEDRGSKASLHGAIDDATGKILGLYFRPEEDMIGYFHVLSQIVQNHGVPHSLYSDRHTIFFSPKTDKLTIEEELAGEKVPLTQFGRALNELHINHIPARSPQAKGRVERLWGTLQGRLVIELRLAGIATIEEANAFLPGFIAQFNERFAVEPVNPESAFKPAPSQEKLAQIICQKHERKASNGSTISYCGQTYRLLGLKGNVVPLKPRSTVTVLVNIDGSLSALYEDHLFALQAFIAPPSSKAKQVQSKESRQPYKPPAEHPWRPSPRTRIALDPVEQYLEANRNREFWEEVYAQR
jgi:transposase